jgi:hypothetical protein
MFAFGARGEYGVSKSFGTFGRLAGLAAAERHTSALVALTN